jgi:hypothetical protein
MRMNGVKGLNIAFAFDRPCWAEGEECIQSRGRVSWG